MAYQNINSMDWTPKMCLRDALEHVEAVNPQKMLIIFLDDEDGGYRQHYWNCGMKCSEIIALCEVTKDKMLREMFVE